MPYVLTEAEKEAIRQQYRHNIETINSYIPPELEQHKLKLDMAGLNKKLNDPSQNWIFKKSLEANAREAKKKDIQEALWRKYSPLQKQGKIYSLSRFLHTELIPSDDPEAAAYNEAVMKNYIEHPEALVQKKFQRLMNSSVAELAAIAKCKDKKALMTAWADRHPDLVQDCFEFFGTISQYPPEMLSPKMREFYSSVGRNFEIMMDTADLMMTTRENQYTLPTHLAQEQQFILGGSSFASDHPDLDEQLDHIGRQNYVGAKTGNFEATFKMLETNHIDVKAPGALLKYVARVEGQNPPYVSLGNWCSSHPGVNPTIVQLSDEDVNDIRRVFNQDYIHEEGYVEPVFPAKFRDPDGQAARNDLVFKYAVAQDQMMYEVDNGGFSKIAEHIAGGLRERMFGTTSREYKYLIQSMKDYDNPNHVHHNDSNHVKLAANRYLIHKGVKTREEANALPYPAKDRALLCFDVIETFQKYEDPAAEKMVPGVDSFKKANNNIYNNIIQNPASNEQPAKKRWPPAIEDEKEVEEAPIESVPHNSEKSAAKENEIAVDEQIIENN